MVILVFETWSLQFFCDLLNGQKTNYLQLIQYKLYFDVGVSTQLANRKRGTALSNLLLLEQYEVLSKNSKLNENTHRERKKINLGFGLSPSRKHLRQNKKMCNFWHWKKSLILRVISLTPLPSENFEGNLSITTSSCRVFLFHTRLTSIL